MRPHETRTRSGNGPAPASSIASSMPVSRIREIMELAWADPEAIHLEVGEPDFPTPEHVVEAAHEAARTGLTRYAPNAGLPVLREALADKVARRNGYRARPEQVVVTQGGIQALYLALRALLEPGDEVLLPDPAWPNYRMIAHLLGARVLSSTRWSPGEASCPAPRTSSAWQRRGPGRYSSTARPTRSARSFPAT